MGSLRKFNIQEYINKYDIKTFVETGTARGHGLEFALEFEFNKLYSIEYDKGLFEFSKQKFKSENRVFLINNNSKDGLKEVFKNRIDGNILFWLDAHYPFAAIEGSAENFNAGAENLRHPLSEELNMIIKNRSKLTDVIIIDDLRIYENNNYETGNLPDFIVRPSDNLNSFYEFFEKTHNIEKNISDEGYLIISPKL